VKELLRSGSLVDDDDGDSTCYRHENKADCSSSMDVSEGKMKTLNKSSP
jgi:hypothetical protein